VKILVTGARGQLGSAIVAEFSGHSVSAFGRGELDLTDDAAILESVVRERPSVIVNCAAYNSVDEAEDRVELALAVNALAVRGLARAASAVGATLVHYSTDFVFDGDAAAPYTEADPPAPKSVYGMSKLLGEWLARDAPQSYVLRVESLFGGDRRRSSTDRIVDAILERRDVPAFVDRTVSPSYVLDVSRATRRLLESSAPGGLYHCVNSGLGTWYEVAAEAARLLRTEANLIPVHAGDLALKAPRPKFCALSNEKLRGVGIDMPTWQDALERYLHLRAEGPRAASG
jgi:dTDP-4-dehydrorhamnose reductase